jgi:hypothetical protein
MFLGCFEFGIVMQRHLVEPAFQFFPFPSSEGAHEKWQSGATARRPGTS